MPPIKYVKSNTKNIAYRLSGRGTKPLVMINGWVTNIEEMRKLPGLGRWLDDLATFSRVVVFDKRGVGLSDRVNEQELPGLRERIEDIRSILDQEKMGKATLLGVSEGGPIAMKFAHEYPERTERLILIGSFAHWLRGPSYPYGIPEEIHKKTLEEIEANWGGPIGYQLMAPSLKNSPSFQKAWASFLRKSASPGTASAFYRMNLSIDVRGILSEITVPALVMHRKNDRLIPVQLGKYIADRIPGARWIELEGDDHLPWVGEVYPAISAIANFMGERFLPHREVIQEGKLRIKDLDTLHAIKTWIAAHYLEEFAIEDLCHRFGINAFKLKFGFKRLFGIAVMQFMRRKRLEYADKLLKESRMNIKEIAYKAGYRHPESFSKAYNREFGRTPSEARDPAETA